MKLHMSEGKAGAPSKTIIPSIIRITGIIIIYALVGRTSLLLAIPPGYASPFFPPAGIALVAILLWGNRVWPGVFLGSFLLNLWVNGSSNETLLLSTILVALGLAAGSTLQANISSYLVKRFVGFATPLDREKNIVRFIL